MGVVQYGSVHEGNEAFHRERRRKYTFGRRVGGEDKSKEACASPEEKPK